MAKVTFNGPNKQIIINEGVTEIDVMIDLYMEWKSWLVNTSYARRFLPAFKSTGREPTNSDETQFTPAYFFILNGWTIVGENGENISIQTNLYPDPDGTTTTASMITTSNNTNIFNRQSDSPIVASELEKSLEYAGVVYVDSNVTETGNVYPYGTAAKPVNNMEHAMVIASYYGFTEFHVTGTIVITQDASNFQVVSGAGETIIINSGYTITNASFDGCTMQGDLGILSTNVDYTNCVAQDGLLNVGCDWYNSGFLGEIILREDNTSLLLVNCYSRPDVPHTGFTLNTNTLSTDAFVIIKGFMGKMYIENVNNSNKLLTISLNSGSVTLRDSNTAGTISVRGFPSSAFTNESTSVDLIVDTNSLLASQSTLDEMQASLNDALETIAFDGIVVYDSEHGIAGTDFPVGTHTTPSNNFTDLMTIAKNRSIEKIHIHNDLIVDEDLIEYVVEGKTGKEVVYLANVSVDGSYFINLYLAGRSSAGSFRGDQVALTQGFYGVNGAFSRSGIVGDITVVGETPTLFLECFALAFDGTIPQILMGTVEDETPYDVNFRGFFGQLQIENMSGVNQQITMTLTSGGIIVSNTCTAGLIKVGGTTKETVVDNSNGTTVSVGNVTASSTEVQELMAILSQLTITDGEVLAAIGETSKQIVRDAMALPTNETVEIGSIDHTLDRTDKNTQE